MTSILLLCWSIIVGVKNKDSFIHLNCLSSFSTSTNNTIETTTIYTVCTLLCDLV